MLRLIALRLLALVPTLLAASVILFIAINVVPGSAAKAALGIDATPQAIARFEAQHGLDRPLHEQYLAWLGKVLPGGGYVPFAQDPGKNLSLMLMPALSLGIVSSALLLRIMRAGMIEVLS